MIPANTIANAHDMCQTASIRPARLAEERNGGGLDEQAVFLRLPLTSASFRQNGSWLSS